MALANRSVRKLKKFADSLRKRGDSPGVGGSVSDSVTDNELSVKQQKKVPKKPLVSVIVPVYNVAEYVAECVGSILGQSYSRLEVIVVDDGSPDNSIEIVRNEFGEDPRLKVVTQPNGGLGSARNFGVRHASGQYLCFVDSDDVIPRSSIEHMVKAARAEQADIVVGAARRFNSTRRWLPEWVTRVHDRDRVLTSVQQWPELLRNNYSWGKLYSATFWHEHHATFREGVAYEDQPIITQLYAVATKIVALREVTYHYRAREDSSSISQQTGTVRDLEHRRLAWEATIEWLVSTQQPEAISRFWYFTIYETHLRWYFDNSAIVEDEYWELLRRAVHMLDAHAPADIETDLHPLRRLALRHIRNDARDELITLRELGVFARRQQAYDIIDGKVVLRNAVPDLLPNLSDRVLPASLLAVDHQVRHWTWHGEGEDLAIELGLCAMPEGLDLRNNQVSAHLEVWNYRLDKSLVVELVPSDDPQLEWISTRLDASSQGSGYTASIAVRDVMELVAGQDPQTLEFVIQMSSGTVTWRSTLRHYRYYDTAGLQLPRIGPDGRVFSAVMRPTCGIKVGKKPRFVVTEMHAATDPNSLVELVISDNTAAADVTAADLSVGTVAVTFMGNVARVNVPVDDIVSWDSAQRFTSTPVFIDVNRVGLANPLLPYLINRRGQLHPELAQVGNPVVTSAQLDHDAATLTLNIQPNSHSDIESVALVDPQDRPVVSVSISGGQPDRVVIPLLTQVAPDQWAMLRSGNYRISAQVRMRTHNHYDAVPVMVHPGMVGNFPAEANLRRSRVKVSTSSSAELRLSLTKGLRQDEQGAFNQNRIRQAAIGTGAELRGVLFRSYFGESVSCNGRAITQELLRRGVDIPIYWAVQDGSVAVPDGVEPVITSSQRWYEVLQTAKYYVDNMFQPYDHVKPDGQQIIETFHGYPFKVMGHTLWESTGVSEKRIAEYDSRAADWRYLLSPAPYATPLLQREFRYHGDVLEIGYPRNDILLSEQAEPRRAQVRQWLGLQPDETAVLYAPTFRDNMSNDGHRARFVDLMDIRRVAEELGEGFRLLVRGHAFNARMKESLDFGSQVIDVTTYPEVADLYLAADLAVADYSSLRFDFAVTGKPLIFFVPDLADYEQMRGWILDYRPTAPGPLVDNRAELVEWIRNYQSIPSQFADLREQFRRDYIPLEDGHASQRFVDAVFTDELAK